MALKSFTIKRLRTDYQGKEHWVPLGILVVDDREGGAYGSRGSVYMHTNNEVWRIYPRDQQDPQRNEPTGTPRDK